MNSFLWIFVLFIALSAVSIVVRVDDIDRPEAQGVIALLVAAALLEGYRFGVVWKKEREKEEREKEREMTCAECPLRELAIGAKDRRRQG